MILPIVSFGSSILREKCKEINRGYSNLSSLIDDMFETMYEASGVGLAAPQINKTIKLFIIDTTPDSILLTPGCYRFEVHDTDDDGEQKKGSK